MKFAIRDDDTSFFTDPEDLEMAFSDVPEIPISLSIIPSACFEHGKEKPYGDGPAPCGYGNIGDNKILVEYIRNKMSAGRYEVVMHGIHHEYRAEHGSWIPEMACLDYDTIKSQLPAMRNYLEQVFQCEVTTFAAPSNVFSPEAFKVLDQEGMNTMCLLSKHIDHPLSIQYLKYFMLRNFRKLAHRSQYTQVLNYKNHKELPLFPLDSVDELWRSYCELKKYNLPMIIYTHYWELNRSDEEKEKLTQIVKMMIADGATPSFVSDCFQP